MRKIVFVVSFITSMMSAPVVFADSPNIPPGQMKSEHDLLAEISAAEDHVCGELSPGATYDQVLKNIDCHTAFGNLILEVTSIRMLAATATLTDDQLDRA